MIESVTIVLELVAVMICLSFLYGKRIKINFYGAMLLVIYPAVFMGINWGHFPVYISMLAYVCIILYCMFSYKKGFRVTLVNFFLAFAIIGLLQLIFYIPVIYLLKIPENDSGLKEILINILCTCTMLTLGNKIRLKELSDFMLQKRWVAKALLVFVILYLFANIFHMQEKQSINSMDFIQTIFFVLLFFLTINEWQKAIAEAERKKAQLEMNRLYYEAYDELILLIRERQHDMKNHINAILGMIYTTNNYEELVENQKQYCDDVVEKSRETKLLLSIGNPLIAGFIYRKFQEAQKSKITIECKEVSKDSNYLIPEYELIEMLGILLDNAIEALNENEEIERNIYVRIDDRDDQFLVSVSNKSKVFGPDEICKFFQKDFTSKGKGHGIGLTKLKRMVQEKDGDIIVTNEDIEGNNYLQFCIVLQKKG